MNGFKTIIAVGAVIIAGAVEAAQTVDWIGLVGNQTAGVIVSGLGVAFGILRWVSTGPIFGGPKS